MMAHKATRQAKRHHASFFHIFNNEDVLKYTKKSKTNKRLPDNEKNRKPQEKQLLGQSLIIFTGLYVYLLVYKYDLYGTNWGALTGWMMTDILKAIVIYLVSVYLIKHWLNISDAEAQGPKSRIKVTIKGQRLNFGSFKIFRRKFIETSRKVTNKMRKHVSHTSKVLQSRARSYSGTKCTCIIAFLCLLKTC